MTHDPSRRCRLAPAALALGLMLASCGGSTSTGGVSAPIGPDAPQRLCERLGFMPGSPGLASCLARIDGLARELGDSRKRCEGIRQRGLSTPFPSAGTGSTIANANADYESCMSGQLVPPAQLSLPSGGTTSCRVLRSEIACD